MTAIPYSRLMQIITAHQADLLTVLRPSSLDIDQRQAVLERSSSILRDQLLRHGIDLQPDDTIR